MTAPLPAPADLAPAGPRRRQRGIQLPQLLLSLLVVAVFALLAVWWQASSTSRSPVLALAQSVTAGEPVQPSDLTEIYISSDVPPNVLDGALRDQIIGTLPVADMAAGTIINADMFLVGSQLQPGQAFVGLVLDGTRAPVGLRPGDRVQVIDLTSTDSDVNMLSLDAGVETATYQGGSVSVRLRLDIASAQRVQLNATSVALIEVDNSGQASWEESPS